MALVFIRTKSSLENICNEISKFELLGVDAEMQELAIWLILFNKNRYLFGIWRKNCIKSGDAIWCHWGLDL